MSLERFIQAQETSYESALAELKAGKKSGCWIWWIFPQGKRPDVSDVSVLYAIADEAEAFAYLQHPILGARYRECLAVVHGHLCKRRVAPLALMGSEVDVLKLRSSLKLFLGTTEPTEESFRVQADEVLEVLGT